MAIIVHNNSMSDEIISLKNVNKGFRSGFLSQKKQILFDVSFSVKKGSVVGFIGGNGAGKSTTMKTMLGLIKPDSGNVLYFGGQKYSKNHFKKIGFLPERPQFYKFLSGYEFLIYYGKLSKCFKGAELKQRVLDVLKEVGLFDFKDQLIGSYSKGMNQRVGIAQAILHRPEFIVLDEPLSGLDPDGRFELSQIIVRAATQLGTSILFSSHLLDDTEKICDHIVIIKKGRITFDGSMQNLITSGDEGYLVNYIKNNKNLSLSCDDQKDLTLKIDQLNKEQVKIINVRRKTKTLEEAYVSIINNENNP